MEKSCYPDLTSNKKSQKNNNNNNNRKPVAMNSLGVGNISKYSPSSFLSKHLVVVAVVFIKTMAAIRGRVLLILE